MVKVGVYKVVDVDFSDTWLYLVDMFIQLTLLSCPRLDVLLSFPLTLHSSIIHQLGRTSVIGSLYWLYNQIMILLYHNFYHNARSVFPRGMKMCVVLPLVDEKIFCRFIWSWVVKLNCSDDFRRGQIFFWIRNLLSSWNAFRASNSRVLFL